MRLSLRNADGREIDFAVLDDGQTVVQAAVMLLVRLEQLDVGMILSVDDDRPAVEPVELAVTPAILQSVAGRLEALSRSIEMRHPESAADLRVAASLARYAVAVGWVCSVISVARDAASDSRGILLLPPLHCRDK
jgi:hypothetical protein